MREFLHVLSRNPVNGLAIALACEVCMFTSCHSKPDNDHLPDLRTASFWVYRKADFTDVVTELQTRGFLHPDKTAKLPVFSGQCGTWQRVGFRNGDDSFYVRFYVSRPQDPKFDEDVEYEIVNRHAQKDVVKSSGTARRFADTKFFVQPDWDQPTRASTHDSSWVEDDGQFVVLFQLIMPPY